MYALDCTQSRMKRQISVSGIIMEVENGPLGVNVGHISLHGSCDKVEGLFDVLCILGSRA